MSGVEHLPLDQLTIGEDVRLDEDGAALDELATSISTLGVLQPLTVRPAKDGRWEVAGRWEVVAGRRRLAAARIAGLDTIPCIVRALDDDQAFDAALAENLHRRDLSWIEVALAYARLRDRGLTQAQIGAVVGKSHQHVSFILQLLTIPTELQDRVHRREISYMTALDLHRRGRTRKQGGGIGQQVDRADRRRRPDSHPLATPPRPPDLRDRTGHQGARRRRLSGPDDARTAPQDRPAAPPRGPALEAVG